VSFIQVSHVSQAQRFLGQGAWSKGQEVSLSVLIPLRPFIFYSLAPCTLLLAPFETEQAKLAKVEL
jgi:hypothetical protein